MSDTKLIQPSDYTIYAMNLITTGNEYIDLSTYLVSLDVFEDIYYPYVTASILIDDMDGVMESGKFIGDEKVQLKFSTGNDFADMDKVFDVWSITDVVGSKGQTYYKLECITYLSSINNNIRLSKAYTGYAHTLIEKIMRTTMGYEGKLMVEPVKYTKTFVCPNWKPLRLINYLAYTSVSSDSDDDRNVGYIFYESRDGYNFVTMDTLYNKDSIHILKDLQAHNTGEIDFNQVKDIHIPLQYDTLGNQLSGTYGNTTYTHNIVTKTFQKKTYVSDSNRGAGLYSENNVIGMFPCSCFAAESGSYGNLHRSKINEFKNFNITVELYGNSNISIGDTINYTIATRLEDDSIAAHRIYPNKHLVTKVRHNITLEGYIMTLELSSKEWK